MKDVLEVNDKIENFIDEISERIGYIRAIDDILDIVKYYENDWDGIYHAIEKIEEFKMKKIMNKMTLIEFIAVYKPKYIKLVYNAHIVNINTSSMWSSRLIHLFERKKYKFIEFKNNNLILEYEYEESEERT